MTDRIPLDHLTSNDLDQLYAETDRLTAELADYDQRVEHLTHELAALREVTRGYCPACRRGDAAPTAQQWEEQRQRADQATRERDEARATNQRLNHEKQRLESELATYRRAVAQWEISNRSTYVPLRTLAAIAKAAGRDIETRQWLLHYQRVEQAEATLTRVQALAVEYPVAVPTNLIDEALDEPAREPAATQATEEH